MSAFHNLCSDVYLNQLFSMSQSNSGSNMICVHKGHYMQIFVLFFLYLYFFYLSCLFGGGESLDNY